MVYPCHIIVISYSKKMYIWTSKNLIQKIIFYSSDLA